jgi:hypothetical protein
MNTCKREEASNTWMNKYGPPLEEEYWRYWDNVDHWDSATFRITTTTAMMILLYLTDLVTMTLIATRIQVIGHIKC